MIDILDSRALYQRVEQLRNARGWSVYELARNAAISPMTLYHWRDRNSSPSLALLEAVCSAFQITLFEFLADETDETVPLNPEQREVLRLWEKMNPEQRKHILGIMRTLS